ncbi:hypothetical protein RRG08_000181 [Elysia crispata]|uniref:Uncharacterized protein n=1 Tax=Elysia crispata TaxID=231223 RepID=A0AAE0YV98_9GAST|nr:hypothetical protein RRG08_000181 [Elysia crispata]
MESKKYLIEREVRPEIRRGVILSVGWLIDQSSVWTSKISNPARLPYSVTGRSKSQKTKIYAASYGHVLSQMLSQICSSS